jgi:hypothetical protein
MNYVGRSDRVWVPGKEDAIHPLKRPTNFTQILTNGDRVEDEGIIQICHETAERAGHERFSIGSDFDGTMFQEDIGITAFIDKVRDPGFWHLDTETFERNLVSPDLKKGFSNLNREKYHNISAEPIYFPGIKVTDIKACANWILNTLIPQILQLHRNIREEIILKGFDTQTTRIQEFISMLIFLDRVTMEMEPNFSKLIKGRIIPRTRFFAGMTEAEIKGTVQKLYGIGQDAENSKFTVKFDNEVLSGAEGVDIVEKQETISSRATKVTDIKRLFRKIIFLDVGILTIITTNLPIVARTAFETEQSPYYKMAQEQTANLSDRDVSTRHFVYGTDLVVSNGIVLPEIDQRAILKVQKQERFNRLSRTSIGLIAQEIQVLILV